MKRTLSIIVTMALLITQTSVAKPRTVNKQICLNRFGKFQQETVTIDGKENNLFLEYADPVEATVLFQYRCSSLLSYLKETGRLDPFSIDTIEQYYRELLRLGCDEKASLFIENNFAGEASALECFWDIIENTEKNKRIREICAHTLLSELEREELFFLLPSFDSYVESNRSLYQAASTRSSFNISAGISYAQTYVFFPNTTYYVYLQDCTNFASQILEGGGYPQQDTGSENSGWWHKRIIGGTMSNPTVTHLSSKSWRMSDYFCDYFGVSYTTTSHYLFSAYLSVGCFICFDKSYDGDWDHVGFVVDKNAGYNGNLGYYDYLVIQHTPSYYSWASTTPNHWDLLENDPDYDYLYGIIVIN